jgi:hypothetical protein
MIIFIILILQIQYLSRVAISGDNVYVAWFTNEGTVNSNFEVGFRASYEKLRKQIGSGDNDNTESLFDIIAGTFIGAINGAILVSHFLEHRT